jgi:hypothetical protein
MGSGAGGLLTMDGTCALVGCSHCIHQRHLCSAHSGYWQSQAHHVSKNGSLRRRPGMRLDVGQASSMQGS